MLPQSMARPEAPQPNTTLSPSEIKRAALANTQQQLEAVDEIENTIERFFKRDQLLEQQDSLQSKIDASDLIPYPNTPPSKPAP